MCLSKIDIGEGISLSYDDGYHIALSFLGTITNLTPTEAERLVRALEVALTEQGEVERLRRVGGI